MTTTKQYDFVKRLLSVSFVPSAASALSFWYAYNSANQRIRTDAEGLRQMGSFLCREAKISIVQCESEFTGNKYSLKNRLQDVFGQDKSVQTFSGNCGVKLGEPTENVH